MCWEARLRQSQVEALSPVRARPRFRPDKTSGTIFALYSVLSVNIRALQKALQADDL